MANKESKHLSKFRTKLNSNEDILCVLEAIKRSSALRGRLILTNQRLCYYRAGALGETLETMPVSKITSVEYKSVMTVKYFTFHTSNDELSISVPISENRLSVEEFQKTLEQLRDDTRGIVSSVPSSSTIASQIKEYSELHAQGILTDEEFSAKKTELLAKL